MHFYIKTNESKFGILSTCKTVASMAIRAGLTWVQKDLLSRSDYISFDVHYLIFNTFFMYKNIYCSTLQIETYLGILPP